MKKGRAFLSKDEDKLVYKLQNEIKMGWELSDENIEILENLFKKAIQEGYQFFENYDRKIISTGGWRSVLGLYIIYNHE